MNQGYGDMQEKAMESIAQKPGAGPAPAPGAAPEAAQVADPIISALQTVATWIQGQIEQGNPSAEEWKSTMLQLLQSIQGGAGAEAGAPPVPGMAPGMASPGEEVAQRNQPKIA